MNKKIGFILALVVISLVMLGTVSAGFFDFLGGNNANQTANDENTFIVLSTVSGTVSQSMVGKTITPGQILTLTTNKYSLLKMIQTSKQSLIYQVKP